mmetsp:Transcript_19074/g.44579  ORF Transcript_19074/g.44579 Transcript_19074/m.44579 type:complete len:218 (-) Transcript_19074:539-1192(-)
MSHDLLCRPCQHWTNREVLQAPLPRSFSKPSHYASLLPVRVDKQHRLCRTLLPTEGIGVLVSLPHYVVHLHWLRTKYLPVKACILKLHSASQVQCESLRHLLRPSEESHAGVAVYKHLVHDRAFAVEQVHVCHRQAHMVHHPQKLLHAQLYLLIDLHGHLIAHEKTRHRLQAANLKREIEGRHNCTPAKRHPDSCGSLPKMIARHSKGSCQVSHLVT